MGTPIAERGPLAYPLTIYTTSHVNHASKPWQSKEGGTCIGEEEDDGSDNDPPASAPYDKQTINLHCTSGKTASKSYSRCVNAP